MSIIGKLFSVIRKVIEKIVDFVVKFIKKYWWVLLIVAAIYFAPAMGAFFASNGMAGLGSVFTTIGTSITPSLVQFGTWAWDGLAGLAGSAWTAFKSAELGTQLSIVGGAAALLAPEEAAELVSEVADGVGDLVGTIVDTVASVFPDWVWIAGAAALVWWLWPSSSDRTVVVEGVNNGS